MKRRPVPIHETGYICASLAMVSGFLETYTYLLKGGVFANVNLAAIHRSTASVLATKAGHPFDHVSITSRWLQHADKVLVAELGPCTAGERQRGGVKLKIDHKNLRVVSQRDCRNCREMY